MLRLTKPIFYFFLFQVSVCCKLVVCPDLSAKKKKYIFKRPPSRQPRKGANMDYIRASVSVTDHCVGPRNTLVPTRTKIVHIRTNKTVPAPGLLLVGLGGNNGTTVAASILANRWGLSWKTKSGTQHPNYFGSVMQSARLTLARAQRPGRMFISLCVTSSPLSTPTISYACQVRKPLLLGHIY